MCDVDTGLGRIFSGSESALFTQDFAGDLKSSQKKVLQADVTRTSEPGGVTAPVGTRSAHTLLSVLFQSNALWVALNNVLQNLDTCYILVLNIMPPMIISIILYNIYQVAFSQWCEDIFLLNQTI